MKRILLGVSALVLSCLLALSLTTGCGGGSGGGDAGSGDGSVSLSTTVLTFNHAMGGPLPSEQRVTAWFGTAASYEVGYPPGVSDPGWLKVEQADSSDHNSPIDFKFYLNRYRITAGTHQTTVRFVAKDLLGLVKGYQDMRVTCVATNTLVFEQETIEFFHYYSGMGRPIDQSIAVFGDGIAWTADADQNWVILNTTSNTAPSSLEIGVDPDGLYTGNHTATVSIRDTSSGHVATLAVNLAVEPHQLVVGDNGVALASFPTALSVLSHTVTVADNAGTPTAWSAVSDQSWLAVTASGVTDGSLTLTADPTGLTTDRIHYAMVTVSSSHPAVANTEQIQVGFFVDDSDPAVSGLNVNGTYLAADPIRPYVYVPHGSTLDVYNIYTGETVGSIDAGATLAQMTISTDGATLFAHVPDDDDIVLIDLESLSVAGKWLDIGDPARRYARLEYTRFNGRGVVLVGTRQILDAADGTFAAEIGEGGGYDIVMAASHNNSSFYVIETGLSGLSFDLERFTGHYSVINGTFKVTLSHRIATPFTAKDIAVNGAGTKIYLYHNLRPYVFDGDTLAEGNALVDPGGEAVDIGPTDKVYITASSSEPFDVYSYNADDSAGDTYSVQGALSMGDIQISGDGLRMISLSGYSPLTFTELTP